MEAVGERHELVGAEAAEVARLIGASPDLRVYLAHSGGPGRLARVSEEMSRGRPPLAHAVVQRREARPRRPVWRPAGGYRRIRPRTPQHTSAAHARCRGESRSAAVGGIRLTHFIRARRSRARRRVRHAGDTLRSPAACPGPRRVGAAPSGAQEGHPSVAGFQNKVVKGPTRPLRAVWTASLGPVPRLLLEHSRLAFLLAGHGPRASICAGRVAEPDKVLKR